MNGQDLVNKYLKSVGQYAKAEFGKVTVVLTSSCSDVPLVEISWPSPGAVATLTALEFAASLTEATACALAAERIIDEWDGVDQWREPGLR